MEKSTRGPSELDPTRPKRPFPVKLLTTIFIFWGLQSWVRFVKTIIERSLVFEYLSSALFGYLIGTGLVLGLVAFLVVFGLLRRAGWARLLTWIAVVLFPAVFWFKRMALWQDAAFEGVCVFFLLLTVLWFGLACWALCTNHSRAYFSIERKGKA